MLYQRGMLHASFSTRLRSLGLEIKYSDSFDVLEWLVNSAGTMRQKHIGFAKELFKHTHILLSEA